MKKLRRVILFFLLSVGVLLTGLAVSVFLYKDRIIRQFIAEANKQLNTPVRIGKFEVSAFQEFPNLSIVLTEVYVEDSHPGEYPLLTASRISFQMNPVNVWQGDYTIKGVQVFQSETNLKINATGSHNYRIIKDSPGSPKGSVKFELRDVLLRNTVVHYIDIRSNHNHYFNSKEVKASIASENDLYRILAEGDLTTEQIEVNGTSYLKGKSFDVISDLLYDDIKKELLIRPSSLKLNKALFHMHGSYLWKTKNIIDLKTDGRDTDIQTLLSLMPESTTKKFDKYQSDGDVYFHSVLKGEISDRKLPSLQIDFGFKNATIFHPEYRTRVEDATMTGSFYCSDLSKARYTSLVLKDIRGRLNNESFQGNFILNDFTDPAIICNFKGKLDARSVLGFYPVETLEDVSGSLFADVSLEGRVGLLRDKETAQRVSASGTIDLQDIYLTYGKNKTNLEKLNGSLQFSNNDLALSDVSGKLGKTDFLLNGFFKNVITFLLFEKQQIGIETDLKSSHVDLDELFDMGFGTGSSDPKEEYTFSISPDIYLNFNCDVNSINYKKFSARNVTGDLLVKNEVAVSRNLSMKTMGGEITVSGIVDAKNHKAIDVVTTLKLNGVHIDSAFYVFENFRQDFIMDHHLKGKATADVNMEMTLNEHLKLFQPTLIADIGVVIRNGQLNNFEPIKKLNKYLDDEGLNRLRFTDLKNDIHIENKTVYIPEMDIRSNVTDLKISGTHTFDQLIDYRVVTPLRRRKVIDVDSRAAVEVGLDGQPKLFLKITGTTDNYKVSYDTEAVRKKIGDDLKREVKELKDAFTKKGKKKEKEIELEKDDYFDWEN